jgi:hypothetical protein
MQTTENCPFNIRNPTDGFALILPSDKLTISATTPHAGINQKRFIGSRSLLKKPHFLNQTSESASSAYLSSRASAHFITTFSERLLNTRCYRNIFGEKRQTLGWLYNPQTRLSTRHL